MKENHLKEPSECREYLIRSIKEQMAVTEDAYEFENKKTVMLIIGVNGVGKMCIRDRCSHCGELMMPHRVCKACGYYDKKSIVEVQ